MRTTVDISDSLLVACKKAAAEMHKPLRFLIEAGLREQLRLRSEKKMQHNKKPKIEWVTVEGAMSDVDLSDREAMQDWLRKL